MFLNAKPARSIPVHNTTKYISTAAEHLSPLELDVASNNHKQNSIDVDLGLAKAMTKACVCMGKTKAKDLAVSTSMLMQNLTVQDAIASTSPASLLY